LVYNCFASCDDRVLPASPLALLGDGAWAAAASIGVFANYQMNVFTIEGECAGQEGSGFRNMTDPGAQLHFVESRRRVTMSRNADCVLIMCHCRRLQGGGKLTD
jgi:hypothetical protein